MKGQVRDPFRHKNIYKGRTLDVRKKYVDCGRRWHSFSIVLLLVSFIRVLMLELLYYATKLLLMKCFMNSLPCLLTSAL